MRADVSTDTGRNLRILVVDDDPDNRRMLTRRLERRGYLTGAACDGRESIDILKREHFDIVLMDYMMPEMNGIEALRVIRETHSPGALPVIIVTAKTDSESVVEALNAGANDYIAKPIEMPVALARIAAQVTRLQAERDLAAMNETLEQRVAERTDELEREIERRTAVEETMLTTQRRLEQASTAKTRFLANMSHELRTPLNAIIGFADLMINNIGGNLEPPEFRGYVSNIHESGKHLLEIINDILYVVSLENDKIALAESTVSIDQILDASCRMFVCQARDEQVKVAIERKNDHTRLKCDPRLLRQAVINLVGNAIKHTPPNGTVSVSFRTLESGEGAIVVKDSGSGIPRSKIAELLKPFEQLETQYSRAHGGLGLGLPLVVGIAKCHGGRFEIESDEGQGVEASLIFPADRIKAEDVSKTA